MILNKVIVEEIKKCGYENVEVKVVTHKKKTWNNALDKNIEMGIYLEVSNGKSTDTYVRYKITVIPSNNDILYGISGDYFCEKANIPELTKNPGGKIMFNKIRENNLCIVKDLWVHPNLRKGLILEEISAMINMILAEELSSNVSAILLIPEDVDDEHKKLYWQLGYCLINNTNVFIYTNWLICYNLTKAAIQIGAVQTKDNKILVYKTFEDKSKDGYVEVSLDEFVSDVYREAEGQFHMLNAVFNNQ